MTSDSDLFKDFDFGDKANQNRSNDDLKDELKNSQQAFCKALETIPNLRKRLTDMAKNAEEDGVI